MAERPLEIQLRTDELARLARADMDATAKAMVQSALDILTPIARSQVPSRTGLLRQSIRGSLTRRDGHWGGVVKAMGPGFYGRILASGATWDSPIVPRRGRRRRLPMQEFLTSTGRVITTRTRGSFVSLRFQVGGQTLFRRQVVHPPLLPDPWPERAVGLGLGQVAVANEQVVREALGDG